MHVIIHRYDDAEGNLKTLGVHVPNRPAKLISVENFHDEVEVGTLLDDYDYELVYNSYIPLEWKKQPEEWIRGRVRVYDSIDFKNQAH